MKILSAIKAALVNWVTTTAGIIVAAAQGLKAAGIAWETNLSGHHLDALNAITAIGLALGLGAAKDGHKADTT